MATRLAAVGPLVNGRGGSGEIKGGGSSVPSSGTAPGPPVQRQPHSHTRAEEDAAVVIQRHYRGYRVRKDIKQLRLHQAARWDDLVRAAEEKSYAIQQLDNKNDVSSRWKRAVHAAARLEAGKRVSTEPAELGPDKVDEKPDLSEKERKERKATFLGKLNMGIVGKDRDETEELPYTSKALEQQHWLEMIDGKHRYGSNLKYYFRNWKDSDTQDNFFRWLDRGEGKHLDLDVLPRERLERERIKYLSAEQRLNYLVKVDRDGLLRWVRNNELVDTAAGKWRDSGDGGGIIPDDSADTEEDMLANASGSDTSSLLSDTYSASSDLQDNADTHYVGLDESKHNGWLHEHKKGLTPAGIRKKILKKTLRRNTWIYVCDVKMNMYIGIKHSGYFQHSSFLAGGKVTSAGLIVVKHGLIKSLNPHSGHYRSTIQHYRAFIARLEDKGADLSHVKIAKSVWTLWGLSKYAAAIKAEKDLSAKFKKVLGLPHPPTEAEKSAELEKNAEKEEEEHQERMRKVQSAEEAEGSEEGKMRVRREVLYGMKKEQEEKKDDTRREVVDPVAVG